MCDVCLSPSHQPALPCCLLFNLGFSHIFIYCPFLCFLALWVWKCLSLRSILSSLKVWAADTKPGFCLWCFKYSKSIRNAQISTLVLDLDISICSMFWVITAKPPSCEHDFCIFHSLKWVKSNFRRAVCSVLLGLVPPCLAVALFIFNMRLLLQKCELHAGDQLKVRLRTHMRTVTGLTLSIKSLKLSLMVINRFIDRVESFWCWCKYDGMLMGTVSDDSCFCVSSW